MLRVNLHLQSWVHQHYKKKIHTHESNEVSLLGCLYNIHNKETIKQRLKL
jgi:hypothetical protein